MRNKQLAEEATKVEDAVERKRLLAKTQEANKLLVPMAAKLISHRKKKKRGRGDGRTRTRWVEAYTYSPKGVRFRY